MAKSSKRTTTVQDTRQTKKQIAMGRKEARQNRIILISVILLVTLVVLILAFGLIQELLLKPSQPVAEVNGVKIPADEYQDLVTYTRYNQYVNISNLQNAIDELQTSPEGNEFIITFYEQQLSQLQSSLALLPQDTLDEMIDDELIREEAEAQGLTVTADEVEQSITEDLRRALSTPPQEPLTGTTDLLTPTPIPQESIDELYNRILGNMQLSKKSFRAIVQRSLLRGKVQELLASQVPTTGLVIQVQLIETETEEEATAAQERIEGGEDFALVAQEVSTDTLSAESGGDLGWIAPGQLSPRYGEDLEAFVFSLAPGELGIVESNGMYYVVLVSERDENGPLPEEVLSAQQNSALRDWLDERKASPDVVIERLLEPDQIPADPFTRAQGF